LDTTERGKLFGFYYFLFPLAGGKGNNFLFAMPDIRLSQYFASCLNIAGSPAKPEDGEGRSLDASLQAMARQAACMTRRRHTLSTRSVMPEASGIHSY